MGVSDLMDFTLYKSPRYKENKSKIESQKNSKHIEGQEDAVPMSGIETRFLTSPAHNLAPIPTTLTRFQDIPFLVNVTPSI